MREIKNLPDRILMYLCITYLQNMFFLIQICKVFRYFFLRFLFFTLLGVAVTDLARGNFLCTCTTDFQGLIFNLFLQFFEVFRIFFLFFVNFFDLHFPGVAVIDLAWWNSSCTLFNWFARFILFLFFKVFLYLKCLEFFFFQLFRWFFQRLQLLTSRY